MAATPVIPDPAPGDYSTSGQVLTQTPIDTGDGNTVEAGESLTLIIVRNTGGSAHTFTITSQPDACAGRLGDVSQSIAAGEERIWKLPASGWADVDGLISFGGDDAELEVKIITI